MRSAFGRIARKEEARPAEPNGPKQNEVQKQNYREERPSTRDLEPRAVGRTDVSFTQEKLDWFDQIRFDRRIKAETVVVGLAIGQRISRTERCAWPKQKTLAADTGLSERQVRTEIRSLIENEHLRKFKRGRGNLNAYAWILHRK